MGDFVYNGEHAIEISGINTWDKWKMAPTSRPFVSPPSVKEEYVNVPGADGQLDYTEVLTGKPRYANRTGSWQFIVENGHFNWPELYSDILNTLHGKKHKIVLVDDPDYYYQGRLSVSGQFGAQDFSTVNIGYNLDPFKYPTGSTATEQWKWDSLFTNTIYYGAFTVFNFKCHTILNDDDVPIVCNMNSTAQMKIFRCFNDSDVYNVIRNNFDVYNSPVDYEWLLPGDNEVTLHKGPNIIYFVGNGYVKVEYERGRSL